MVEFILVAISIEIKILQNSGEQVQFFVSRQASCHLFQYDPYSKPLKNTFAHFWLSLDKIDLFPTRSVSIE